MNGAQCVCASRRALSRVLPPLERHKALPAPTLLPIVYARAALPATRSSRIGHQTRFFAVGSKRLARARDAAPSSSTDEKNRGFDKRYTTREDFEKSGRDRLPQDHEITDPMIMVLEDGNLDGPVQTRQVLQSIDPAEESLRMITPYIPGRPKDQIATQYAICKIVNKKNEYERQRQLKERKKQSKAATSKVKEMELNWGISDNDLGTKLRQIASFLGKGMKVEVILGIKKRAKKVDDDAAVDLVKRVKKNVAEMGAREWKPEDGHVGKTFRLYFEGSKQQQQSPKQQKPAEEETPASS